MGVKKLIVTSKLVLLVDEDQLTGTKYSTPTEMAKAVFSEITGDILDEANGESFEVISAHYEAATTAEHAA
jgi:hypothetical protein